jgi:hypothetical protein
VMSVYESGLAAGANWGTIATADDLVKAVGAGANGTGNFSTVNFAVPGLPLTDSVAMAAIEGHITGTAPNFVYSP